MTRRDFIKLLGGSVATWPLAAHSQQGRKTHQIGFLSLGRGDKSDAGLPMLDAFISALRELGYTEGQNIALDRKFADGDVNKLSELAQEFVERRVDAIVTQATPAARPAAPGSKQARHRRDRPCLSRQSGSQTSLSGPIPSMTSLLRAWRGRAGMSRGPR